MLSEKNKYYQEWRKKNPHRYHLIQLRWYYKNRELILTLQTRPNRAEDEEADKWLQWLEFKRELWMGGVRI